MSENLLSIIIPVYNAEKYIEECVNSLNVYQRDDCEVILVNDGSKDSSGKICESLKNQYKNIIYIDSENFGVSHARNLGLEAANGEWIMFVDSDDSLESDTVDYCINFLKSNSCKNAMVRFGMIKDYWKENKIDQSRRINIKLFNEGKEDSKKLSVSEDFNEIFDSELIDSACVCMFKNDIIKSNNIMFKDGMRVREDTDFILRYLKNTDSVFALNKYFYHYRIEGNDSYATRRAVALKDIELLAESFYSLINNIKKDKDIITAKVNYFIYQTLVCGFVHEASKSFMGLYRYIKGALNGPSVFKSIAGSESKVKFHKILLILLKKRFALFSALLCNLALK